MTALPSALLRELWKWHAPKVRDGMTVELCSPPSLVHDELDGWRVRARMHNNRVGRDMVYREAEVVVPGRRFRTDGEMVDYVGHYIGLLAAKFAPPPKPPKGWRLFGRSPRR